MCVVHGKKVLKHHSSFTTFSFFFLFFLLALVLKGLFSPKFFIYSPSHCLKTYKTYILLWDTIGYTLFHIIKQCGSSGFKMGEKKKH